MFVRRCLLPPLCLFVAALLPARIEASQKLTFQWDPSPEPDVVAYRLYVGLASRLYTQTLEVPVPATSVTAADLSDGLHYYFAITAVNSGGVESGYSSELEYVVPSAIVTANALPTLDPLSTIVLSQNSALRTVTLSGISSGSSSEFQPLLVTAVSSNPALIPVPVIFYLSPNSSGALSFTPLVNSWGSATITVNVNDGQLANNLVSKSFSVIVNNAPTLDPISNLSINQDAAMQTISLTGISSGAANENQTLQITATSSNPALVPAPSIFYLSPNSTGALSFKPAAGAAGTATISVTVNDGQAGNNTVVRTFTVTVNPASPNIPPTLNALGNFVVAENAGTTFVSLSGISSGSTAEIQPLAVSATSSNPALIPTPGISYTSPNPSGTLSFAPAANASGTATITVTVADGQPANGSTSRSFVVTVNNPPTLNALGNLSINQDAPMQTVSLSDISSGAAGESQTLQITATSSNPALIPTPSVFYASPNSTAALTFKSAAGATGTSVITVTVNDGQVGNNTITRSFTVTVNAVAPNIAPTLNPIGTYVVTQNSAATAVPLSGITSGSSSEIQPLTVTATSSNPAVIPNPILTYTSPNSTGTLSFAPAANVSGTATITVTVSDGQSFNSTFTRSFTVTVNNTPTLNPLGNLSINQDASLQTVLLSGISSGAGSEAQTLLMIATSSNPALIPAPSILYSSPNSSGTLTFKPTPGAIGSAFITVSVNDGQVGNNSISRSFTVTVNPVAANVAPTLNAIGNYVVAQNSGANAVPLSGIGSGSASEAQPLTVTATSSNPALIPNPVVSYTSPNATGTLVFTPAPNVSGTATVTVSVSDGQALNSTTSRSFVVTVNNPPTLNPLGNLTISQGAPAQAVTLSGITPGGVGEVQTIQISAASSNPALIPTPGISYASPNSTGTLVFQPAAGVTGSATITVTVNDGQLGNNLLVRSFIVTVNSPAPNVAPTLNPLGTVAVTQNSGTRSIPLSGISSGSIAEVQPLTVTAKSSNPALIANPVITYTSPSSTGTLSFTPAANAFGTATITVTVSDGQASNGTVSQAFIVIVNNPPTLNQPVNLTLPVNSRAQTVSLSGIGSGAANEIQTITMTAASSNTGLIPTPVIFYASPNASGALFFTPVTNVSGSATITITVRDGQMANNVVSRSFVVTVSAALQSLSAFSVEGEMTGGANAEFSPPPLESAPQPELASEMIQTAEEQPVVSLEAPATEISSSSESIVPPTVENVDMALEAEAPGPQISALLVASSDARSLVLSWQTDKPATCFLEYGAAESLEWTTETTSGTVHTVALRNLQPATLYYMRVQAADAEGRFTVTEISSAQTPPVNVLAWQAENALIAEPMTIATETEPGGETYISTTASGLGTATWNVEFPEGMSYRVWCRVKTFDGSGLFGLAIDGSPETLANVPGDRVGIWHWVSLGLGDGALSFLANDGPHSLVLRGISVGTLLDEICISNDPEWLPVNAQSAPILSASRASGADVQLEWTDPWSNADGYVIESSDDGVNFESLDTVDSTERSYRVSSPTAKHAAYRIYSFNALDRGAASAVVRLDSNRDDTPGGPVNLAAALSEEGQITLTWDDMSADETSFVVERSIDSHNFAIVQTAGANATAATDVPPGPGRYYYRVRAVSDDAKSDATDPIAVVF